MNLENLLFYKINIGPKFAAVFQCSPVIKFLTFARHTDTYSVYLYTQTSARHTDTYSVYLYTQTSARHTDTYSAYLYTQTSSVQLGVLQVAVLPASYCTLQT
jgi:hypothetical protein